MASLGGEMFCSDSINRISYVMTSRVIALALALKQALAQRNVQLFIYEQSLIMDAVDRELSCGYIHHNIDFKPAGPFVACSSEIFLGSDPLS